MRLLVEVRVYSGAVVDVVGVVVEVLECRWWVKCVDEAPHVKASANLK